MFPNNCSVFDSVLKKLTLQDIMKLRLVCSSFKLMVDDYLKKQNSLNIFFTKLDDDDVQEITAMKSVFKLGNHLMINRDVLHPNNYRQFAKDITKFLPNIRELFILEANHRYRGIIIDLIETWKNINKLIMSIPNIILDPKNLNDSLFKAFNALQSLETFVILDPHFISPITLKNQAYLNRVKNLFVPSIGWLENVQQNSNLKSLGFHRIPSEVPKFWFGKLERVYFSLDMMRFYSSLLNFVRKLRLVNDDNLTSFTYLYFVSFFLDFIFIF